MLIRKAFGGIITGILLLCGICLAMPSPASAFSGFGGNWETNWGPVAMSQMDSDVIGQYAYKKDGRLIKGNIKGSVSGDTLRGTWSQPGGWGQLEFVLSPDGQSFKGRWRNKNQGSWDSWSGVRQ